MPCKNCAYVSAHYKKELAKRDAEIKELKSLLQVAKVSANVLSDSINGGYD